ncbi:hypothetical protein F7725_028172 [Dissostichus mawsoni]|uniref:Uncharacterized protein n=1 Tax=Dissostichus mawsoni TaxID=36200 RepID=A0A7J5XF43_DISMA|nr:hypothetical protein F7725_028172 [Dissostichus mawsoni]
MAEVTFDFAIREGFDDSATDLDSGETGTVSSIAKSKVDEEAGNLVHNETLQVTGETTGEGPYTVGKALMDDVSRASDDTHGAEAMVLKSPVQFQTVMSPIPRNKSRKSKEDSKSLKVQKAPLESVNNTEYSEFNVALSTIQKPIPSKWVKKREVQQYLGFSVFKAKMASKFKEQQENYDGKWRKMLPM